VDIHGGPFLWALPGAVNELKRCFSDNPKSESAKATGQKNEEKPG